MHKLFNIKSEFKIKNFWYGLELTQGNINVQEAFTTGSFGFFKNFWWFFTYRLFLLLFVSSCWLSSHITKFAYGRWYVLLTHWGFTMLFVFSIFSFTTSLYLHVYAKSVSDTISREKRLPWYCIALLLVRDLTFPLAFTVTLLYWILEFRPGSVLDFLGVIEHVLNSLLVILDIFISALPPTQLLKFIYLTILGLVYGILTVICDFAGMDSIYAVIDWKKKPGATALVLILSSLILAPILHVITFLLLLLRLKLSKYYGLNRDKWLEYKRAPKVSQANSEKIEA